MLAPIPFCTLADRIRGVRKVESCPRGPYCAFSIRGKKSGGQDVVRLPKRRKSSETAEAPFCVVGEHTHSVSLGHHCLVELRFENVRGRETVFRVHSEAPHEDAVNVKLAEACNCHRSNEAVCWGVSTTGQDDRMPSSPTFTEQLEYRKRVRDNREVLVVN